MKRKAFWYFDVVSPYTYLQARRFGELEDRLDIKPVPVLFAGLLAAWGQLGPAEIPAKRVQTYRYAHWLANQRGVPFRAPPRHPFNPLAILRLAIVAGNTPTIENGLHLTWKPEATGRSVPGPDLPRRP